MSENPISGDPVSENPIGDESAGTPMVRGKPSGLRNPLAAVRGVGAAALGVEGLVMLLAIIPVQVLDGRPTLPTIGFIVGLAVVCFALAGLLRRPWAWHAGSAVQVALLASGFVLHPALSALGVLFGLLWLYVLHVRRTVLR
jgi:hypothetical protein